MLTVCRRGAWSLLSLVLLVTVAVAQPHGKVSALHEFRDFPDWTTSVAFSPDGEWLAAGSYDLVRLIDLQQPQQPVTLKTRNGFAHSLAFTPDGRQLIVGGYQQVQVWDVSAATKGVTKSATWRGHTGYVRSVAVSPDGQTVATAGEDQQVMLHKLADGSVSQKLGPLEYPVLGVAFSPDGMLLATAEGDETRLSKPGPVTLWNATNGEQVRVLTPHEKAATAVRFSPDGKTLYSTGYDEKVNIHTVETGEARGHFGGHSRPTNCLALSTDGQFVISGSGGRFQGKNEIKIFNPIDGEELTTIDGHTGKVTAIALSPDGRRLASASYDQLVALWDVAPVLAQPIPADLALLPVAATVAAETKTETSEPKVMRIGIIGLDTSHAVAFTKLFNAEKPLPEFAGFRVVAAYPQGSPDIQSSVSRVPGYTADVQKLGVEIVGSIDELLQQVDAVLLETNDGRPHLEQVLPVLKARKPVFVDKPIAGSLVDAIAILEAARHYETPCFSASSLRWLGQAQEIRAGQHGAVLGCDTFSPYSLEATHPDLYWYGIHGVESLVTVMGTGLQSVSRTTTDNGVVVTGVWEGGRMGTFRGLSAGARGYGGTAYCEKKTVTLGPYPGYQPLVVEIAKFFSTGKPPVEAEETLEIYTFMSAADVSKERGGAAVEVQPIREQATQEAKAKLARLLADE